MPRYKVLKGKHLHNGQLYPTGTTIPDLSEDAAARFEPGRLQMVGGGVGDKSGSDDTTDEWSTYLNETSVAEVVSFVESAGTSLDDVRAIRTAEGDGKGRVTVLRAADKRLQSGQ